MTRRNALVIIPAMEEWESYPKYKNINVTYAIEFYVIF